MTGGAVTGGAVTGGAVTGGAGAGSWVRVVERLSLTGGLGTCDDFGGVLENDVVSLRINVPRMGVTSDGLG